MAEESCETMNEKEVALILICGLVALAAYLLPTIIAFRRKHHYKWIILGINAVFGFTGIGFLAAFVWAVWPRQTAFFDVVANDPTTNSPEAGQKIYGQMGTNVRAFNAARSVPPQQVATEPGTQTSSFCSNCGKPVPSQAHFCTSCGMASLADRSGSQVNRSGGR